MAQMSSEEMSRHAEQEPRLPERSAGSSERLRMGFAHQGLQITKQDTSRQREEAHAGGRGAYRLRSRVPSSV